MIQLLSVFKELLSLLNSNRVRYLLLGGYAVGYHGNPRATGDLDLWIAVDPENLAALRRVLIQFGFASSSIPEHLFRDGATMLRIGNTPSRVEILTRATGVEFEPCYQRAINATLDGVPVKIIAKDDLIANKLAAGRMKDLADVDALRERGVRKKKPPAKSSKSPKSSKRKRR